MKKRKDTLSLRELQGMIMQGAQNSGVLFPFCLSPLRRPLPSSPSKYKSEKKSTDHSESFLLRNFSGGKFDGDEIVINA